MSNETTAPTDARLTDADIAELQRCVERSGKYAEEWLISPDDVAALLVDRAALMADLGANKREIQSLRAELNEWRTWADAMNTERAAMRPLVEALAQCWLVADRDKQPALRHDVIPVMEIREQARTLVATWQTEPQQKGDESHAE